MPSNIKKLSDVINSEKEFVKLRETAKSNDVVLEFHKIFPDLKKIADAVKVDKHTLFIKVENSVWKSELNFNKTVIVEKINGYFKENIIKTIKFL